jgi:hypothetical protein
LSRAGYGTPEEILNMQSQIVVTAIFYEKFLREYEEKFLELNKP